MSNGMIHVQHSFRKFARALTKFWLVESWILDTMFNRINLWTIHITANNFRPIRRWETSCIHDSDWSKIIRCDMVSSKDWCSWILYLQNLTPVLFQGSFCASNQRQCIERFVLEDAWYRGILTAMIYGRRFLHLWSVTAFQAELFQGNQISTMVLSITLNSFLSLSLSLPSTVW